MGATGNCACVTIASCTNTPRTRSGSWPFDTGTMSTTKACEGRDSPAYPAVVARSFRKRSLSSASWSSSPRQQPLASTWNWEAQQVR